ncbi:MAG: chemotaxis protein CheW, partial [Oscillospiraceae bacterium]|nr:chemotaxis protein CheW [Oscillospiraceae bacterium]
GNIIPLIDLRLRLGKKEAEYNDHTCVIINKVQGSMIGFIVDEVDAVVDITADIVSKPPRMDDRSESYLIGVARLPDNGKEKIVLCLDGTRVLKNDELDMLISANA